MSEALDAAEHRLELGLRHPSTYNNDEALMRRLYDEARAAKPSEVLALCGRLQDEARAAREALVISERARDAAERLAAQYELEVAELSKNDALAAPKYWKQRNIARAALARLTANPGGTE